MQYLYINLFWAENLGYKRENCIQAAGNENASAFVHTSNRQQIQQQQKIEEHDVFNSKWKRKSNCKTFEMLQKLSQL